MSDQNSVSHPLLTIIICTYNRAELLRTCLESVVRQTVPAGEFAVLVVDNNSSDATHDVVLGFSGALPNLRYVLETNQGLSHARNRGLHDATTSWVAYLDDDAMAKTDWVQRINSMIEHHPFDAFGGIYLPWYRDSKEDWYLDRYATDRTWMPYTEISELHRHCFSGGNAVYKRDAALRAGGFPVNRGMQGEQLGYGEENTLQYELRRLGYRTGIDPDLNIEHLVPRHKQRLEWFLKRRCNEGKIHLWHGDRKPTTRGILSMFAQFLILDMRNLVCGTWRLLKGEYRPQNLFIDTVPELCFQWQVFVSLFSAEAPLPHDEATRSNRPR